MNVAARTLGSKRNRLRDSMWAFAKLYLLNVILTALIKPILKGHWPQSKGLLLLVCIAILGLQFFLIHKIISHHFELKQKKAFWMTGATITSIAIPLLLFFLLIKPYVFEFYVVPTGGNAPTIEPGNRIVANKMLSPHRLDFVVYRPSTQPQNVFCQRLIGMPGERLKFEEGKVYINNEVIPLPEVIAGRCHARSVTHPSPGAKYEDGQTIVLGDDEYFLIGDNLENSYDSRFMGPAHAADIVGVIDLLYLPVNKAGFLR